MGDRVWMSLTCLKKDRKLFENMGFTQVEGSGDTWIELVDESANYAHYDELRKVKAPFVAHHYEGCEYGGVTYACDGKSIKEWAMDHEGFEIVYMSSVDLKTGILRKDVIREYRKFLNTRKRARKLLGLQEDK